MNPWIWLIIAILLEVTGTTSLKLSEGFTKYKYVVLTIASYFASFAFLGIAMKRMELGISYAVWAGMGTALVAVIGVTFFNEPLTTIKLFSLIFIIAGVIGLNLSGAH